MRLLYVCETVDFGVGQNVKDLVELALAEGHEIHLVWSKERSGRDFCQWIEGLRNDRFAHYVIPMARSPGLRDVLVIAKVLRTLQRKKIEFDIVHGLSSKGGAIARIIGLLLRKPRFYTPHAYIVSNPEISRVERSFYFWIERILNFGAHVVCTSQEEVNLTQSIGAKRMKFIPNGIDLSVIPAPKIMKPGMPLRLSFVGRLCEQKDPMMFLRVADHLSDLAVEFHMFGDGELYDTVKRALPPSLMNKITLHGRVATKALWDNIDVLVCTSRYEGFPYAFIQAIARGIPVVSTRVGSTELIITDGETGIIYDEKELQKVRDFVITLCEDSARRELIRHACEQRSRKFSRERMFSSLMEFYNEAIES